MASLPAPEANLRIAQPQFNFGVKNIISPLIWMVGLAIAAGHAPPASAQPTVSMTPSSGSYSAAGGTISFTVTLTYAAAQSALAFTVSAPANWTYGATGGPNPPSPAPSNGDSGEFDFAYSTIPASPVQFTFTVNYPGGLTGNQTFGSISGYFRPSSGSGLQTIAASNVVLTLALTAPTITAQPAGQNVSVGANVTFTAAATGTGPLTYQWERNGSPISGATSSSLSLSSVQTSDAGNYSAVVTDANGLATTSSAATLTLALNSQTIAFPAIGSVAIGIPVVLQASASSGLPVSFAVQSGNATIAGGATLTIFDANPVTIAANCPGNTTYGAAPSVTQTIVAFVGGPQLYFGSIGSSSSSSYDGGYRTQAVSTSTSLAAFINASGSSGTLVGYIAGINAGFIVNFVLSNGRFSQATTAIAAGNGPGQTLTFSGSVSGGVLTGTIQELNMSFSATLDSSGGSTAAISGLYVAAGGSSGCCLYSVVGTQGDVFALAVTPGGISAGAGTVNPNNSFSVTATLGSAAAITGSVNSGTAAISGSITPSSGGSINVSGESSVNMPSIVTQPTSQTANAGTNVALSVAATGKSNLTYQWQLNGSNMPGATGSTLTLSNIGTTQTGNYTVVVADAYNSVSSNAGVVTVNVATHPINISSRAYVGAGFQVLVAGFFVEGQTSETILIRGVGPTLSQQNITGVLASPQLTLYDSSGTVIATNTGWCNAPAAGPSTVAAGVQPATAAIFSKVYAFALPSGSADCALVVTLPPGGYTAQVSGIGAAAGVSLVEVYDIP